MRAYAILFGVTALSTFFFTFLVRRMATRIGAVVMPSERRVHERPTPTSGGAGMFLGFLVAMVVGSRMPEFKAAFEGSSAPLGVVLGASVIFAVGLLDDLREVSAPAKLAGQSLAGSVLTFFGVAMLYFRIPFGDFIVLSPDLTPLVTVLWLVLIANAINLIDGLDGLAAGVVAIGAGAFFVYGHRLLEVGLIEPENVGPLVALVACGVCVGFLPHNFHPARIFMGDAGSMLLGLLMTSATVLVGGHTADQFSGQTFFFFAPVVIPFIILGVPIVDMLFAVIRRAVRRQPLSAPDKEHLHHRLMRLGHGQRRSVLILWAWTAILSGIVLFPTFTGEGNAVIPFALAGLAMVLITLFHPGLRHAEPESPVVDTLTLHHIDEFAAEEILEKSAAGDVDAPVVVPPGADGH